MAVRSSKARPAKPTRKILVSACLAGISCTCKAISKLNPHIRKLVERGTAIPVCPETSGGLGIPREKSEIVGGDGKGVLAGRSKVITTSGKDVTKNYIKGAKVILKLAKVHNITTAILRTKSPACGKGLIYDGTFTGALKKGDGVLAAALSSCGIKVFTKIEKGDRICK